MNPSKIVEMPYAIKAICLASPRSACSTYYLGYHSRQPTH